MSQAKATTDHDEIRSWVEDRGGRPVRVEDTGEGGILRIDFDKPDPGLETVEWETFFDVFEDRRLAFLHQDRTKDGSVSRFNKFVSRDTNQ